MDDPSRSSVDCASNVALLTFFAATGTFLANADKAAPSEEHALPTSNGGQEFVAQGVARIVLNGRATARRSDWGGPSPHEARPCVQFVSCDGFGDPAPDKFHVPWPKAYKTGRCITPDGPAH